MAKTTNGKAAMKTKIIALSAAALLLSGCYLISEAASEGPISSPLSADLVIYYSPNAGEVEGATAESGSMYTLTCLEDGTSLGTYPDPEAACSELISAYNQYESLISEEQEFCAMICGGPDAAKITGSINSRIIDISLDRCDGCDIAEWDAWGEILTPLIEIEKENAASSSDI